MALADKDGSGSIDQDEFVRAMCNRSKKTSRIIREIKKYAKALVIQKHDADLKEAFKVFDLDNTGEIDTEELREIMS